MNMKIMLGLMLMCSMGFATTYLTSCAVLNLTGETYLLSNDIGSPTTPCFTITADSVTLNCQGRSIIYSGNATGNIGISVANASPYITGCTVLDYHYGIDFIAGSNGGTVFGNSIRTKDWTGSDRGISLRLGSGGVLVSSNNITVGISASYDAGIYTLTPDNYIFQNIIMTTDDDGVALHIDGAANTVLRNIIQSSKWVDSGIGDTVFDDGIAGNYYYIRNGTPARDIYNITSTTGTWADGGSDLPFNGSLSGGQWWYSAGTNSKDSHPYVGVQTNPNEGNPNRKNVQITVVDAAFRPLLGTSIKIVQVEPINNTNVTLGTYVTDDFGTTTQSLIPATYLYKFSVYNANGSTLIQAFPTVGIQCSSLDLLCKHTLIVNINSILPFYLRNNLVGSCSYDNGTLTITCSANDTTNTLNNLSLMAYTAGNTTQVCYDSEAASAATLTCELPADCGSFNYLFIGSDGTNSYLLSGTTISQNACTDTTMFGRNGWMALLMLFGTVAMIGYYSIPVAMALGTFSIVLGALMQLVPWTIATPLIIFMAIALIIAYRSKV